MIADAFRFSLEASKSQPATSRIITPADFFPVETPGDPIIEVTDEKTQEAVLRLAPGVTCLNFASAKNPGGGVLRGAKAQEEDLCRCSGLYHELTSEAAKPFYEANRWSDAPPEYYGNLILSERVWMTLDETYCQITIPVEFNVITCPAPNMGRPGVTPAIARKAFEERAKLVLFAAELIGTQNLVLGAWGCGVFGNPPRMVAEVFKEALRSHAGPSLQNVVFAIYGSRANLGAFQKVFGA